MPDGVDKYTGKKGIFTLEPVVSYRKPLVYLFPFGILAAIHFDEPEHTRFSCIYYKRTKDLGLTCELSCRGTPQYSLSMPFTAPKKRNRPALKTLGKNTVPPLHTAASNNNDCGVVTSTCEKKRVAPVSESGEEVVVKKMKCVSPQSSMSTGCPDFDAIISNAPHHNQILEIFGKSGTGKTQVCFGMAVSAASSENSKVVWIGTNRSFRPERIREIIRHRSGSAGNNEGEVKTILDRIMYAEATDGLDSVLKLLSQIRHIPNIKLVIIDSIAAAYKCTRDKLRLNVSSLNTSVDDKNGKKNMSSLVYAKKKLNAFLTSFPKLMEEKHSSAVLVNEVVADFSKNAKADTIRPAISLQACPSRHVIQLSRSDVSGKRKCSSLSGTNAVKVEAYFDIAEKGIVQDS